MSKIAVLAQRWHPIAMVRRAEAEAGRAEARFQLAVLDAIDLAEEPASERARLVRWRRSLVAWTRKPLPVYAVPIADC